MKIKNIKLFAIALITIPMIAVSVYYTAPVNAVSNPDDDAKTLYTTTTPKCAMCHGANAEKSFDPAKSDQDLADIVTNGKKGEKPPFMPAYKDKLTPAQVTALVTYMKDLRKPKQ